MEDFDFDETRFACGFEVLVEVEGTAITIDFGDREFVAVPGTTTSLTNVGTGTTIFIHSVSGPQLTRFDVEGDTFIGTGVWTWGPAHPVTGDPGMWLLKGRFVIQFDANGNLVDASMSGSSTNLCLLLAP